MMGLLVVLHILAVLTLSAGAVEQVNPKDPVVDSKGLVLPDVQNAEDSQFVVSPNGADHHREVQGQPQHCGCFDCNAAIWDLPVTDAAGTYTCGARILWVQQNVKPNETEACLQVAGTEFPTLCGPGCHPARCDGRSTPNYTPPPTVAPLPGKLTANTSLYCFPPAASRKTWTNVWGKYRVEVKEGASCGPSDNKFMRNNVQLQRPRTGDSLMLYFRKQNNLWTGSEVRIVLPDAQMPFKYGTYSFFIQAVRHYKVQVNRPLVANHLPPSLVLGLFTWNDLERYSIHENYNHEVDIEISRWGDAANQDAQFLVQPPEQPHWRRFQSGGSPGVFQQGDSRWQFTWRPNRIDWYTTAGGGMRHNYSTAEAFRYGAPDRIQCLPSNMEVRINLWNLFGTGSATDMKDDEAVYVIIKNFSYSPVLWQAVPKGGLCSKHCQCGRNGLCRNATCA